MLDQVAGAVQEVAGLRELVERERFRDLLEQGTRGRYPDAARAAPPTNTYTRRSTPASTAGRSRPSFAAEAKPPSRSPQLTEGNSTKVPAPAER